MSDARHVLTILAVGDLGRAVRFYRAAFEWPLLVETPVYVELAVPGGQRVGLYARPAFAATAGRPPAPIPDAAVAPAELYLHVTDLDTAIARVVAAGGRPLSPRAPRDWGDEAAYFADPDGTVLAVARPLVTTPGACERLAAVARQWMTEVWRERRLAAIDALHADTFVDHSPAGRGTDRAAYAAGVRELFDAFPDFAAETDAVHVDEAAATVTVRWHARGTHRGPFLGRAPTGRKITFRGIEILTIEADRIVARWGEWDGLDLCAQLDAPG
jgi:steroid delta-isomerase-like uncharacterized protein